MLTFYSAGFFLHNSHLRLKILINILARIHLGALVNIFSSITDDTTEDQETLKAWNMIFLTPWRFSLTIFLEKIMNCKLVFYCLYFYIWWLRIILNSNTSFCAGTLWVKWKKTCDCEDIGIFREKNQHDYLVGRHHRSIPTHQTVSIHWPGSPITSGYSQSYTINYLINATLWIIN